MHDKHQKAYLFLYFSSLILFLINLIFQGQISFAHYEFWGLIIKMSPIFWAGYIILFVLIYYQFINFNKINQRFVYLTFLLLTIYLIGTPLFHEYLPRYQDTWSHSFLANEMFEREGVNNQISWYEDYPGSFLFFGSLFQILPTYATMKFLPIFLYALGLIAIYLIFKYLFNKKISFLASVLYTLFNWTAEDHHISPQFLMLYVYFVFMLVFVKLLTNRRQDKKPYFLLTLLFIPAIVFSHPGTPIFLIFILCSMFFLCKKLRSKIFLSLIVFLVICFSIYSVYRQRTFTLFTPHIEDFFQTIFSGEYSSTTKRLVTNQITRQVFLYSRMAIIGIFVSLGAIGIYRFFKESHVTGAKFFISWAFSIIILTIFSGLALEGEFFEKFVMVSSLPLAATAAYSLIKLKFSRYLILILFIILSPMILIAKYGNEAFESISLETLNTECFDKNSNTGCNERQEIINLQSSFYLKYFDNPDLTISKEEIAGISIFQNKDFDDIINYVDNHTQENKLDKIYSTYLSGVYRR